MHKQPFEKAPLVPGQIETARLPSGPKPGGWNGLRFWSAEMNEPRFMLVLVPRLCQLSAARLHLKPRLGTDRPEDLLVHLKVDEVLDNNDWRGRSRTAIVQFPMFGSVLLPPAGLALPVANYLTLVAEEVASLSRSTTTCLRPLAVSIGDLVSGGISHLDVGRRYPGRFGAVAVVSGFAESDLELLPAVPATWSSGRQRQGQTDSSGARTASPLAVACGAEDICFP